jgi:hypothetical protein
MPRVQHTTVLRHSGMSARTCNMSCTRNPEQHTNQSNLVQRILNVLDSVQHLLYFPFRPASLLRPS